MKSDGHESIHTTELLEKKGWELLNQQKYDEAKQAFAKAFVVEPQNLAAFQGTIAVLRKQRDFAAAEDLLASALAIYPAAPGILSERAWLLIAEKKTDEAIAAFEELLKVKRDDDTLFIYRISLLRSQCRFDEARRQIQEASQIFPDSPGLRNERGWLAFYEKHYDEAAEIFQENLKRHPRNESSLQGCIAALRLQGCYTNAAKLAGEAIAQFPASPGIYSERAWTSFAQARYEEAEADFRKALENAGDDPASFINLAWALIRQDNETDYADAVAQCRLALRLDADRPDAFGCLGIIAFKRGRVSEAEAYLRRSIRADTKLGFHADLGALYTAMGRYDEAKDCLQAAVHNNPEDAYAHVETGNLYIRTGKLKDAAREFRWAVALDPRSPDAWKGLAIALMESDQLDEAEKVLRQAISRVDRPQRWELHLHLCRLLTRLGDDTGDDQFYDEALKEVTTAIGLQPGNPEPFFQGGIVKRKLDDYSGALKSFQRCLKADKNYIAAEVNAARVQALMRKDRARSRASRVASFCLASVFLLQLVALWMLRLWTGKIPDLAITMLVPILLGLLVVAVMLPWLSRLKMTGLEAELSEPKPKDTAASGPKGGNPSGATGSATRPS